LPLWGVTQFLMGVLAMRFAGDLLALWRLASLVERLRETGERLQWSLAAEWALHTLPQTFIYVVMIIMVEGLHRVWRNLRRLRTLREGAQSS
jgi:hypothetical protein